MSKKFINKFYQNYNLNWETLTKNLVILLKDGMGLMIKIFDIMGVSLKNLIFMGASQKPIYSRELPKKQACTICRFNLRRRAL